VQGSNGHCPSDNLDSGLVQRIKRIRSRKKSINFIRLFNDNGYFISDDEGTEWKAVGMHCSKELKKRGTVEEFALAEDMSWVIIRPNSFVSSKGVDAKLKGHLNRFYSEQRERKNHRAREIQEYHDRIQREEQERQEREAREAAERERIEREAREAAEREREEREREEREETAASRAAALEVMLEERVLEEVRDIKESEARLRKRRRSLQATIDEMPPVRRARVEEVWERIPDADSTRNTAECVVCHVHPAARAVVPCGHQCLCDDCSDMLSSSSSGARLCPLCRGNLASTLKIFTAK